MNVPYGFHLDLFLSSWGLRSRKVCSEASCFGLAGRGLQRSKRPGFASRSTSAPDRSSGYSRALHQPNVECPHSDFHSRPVWIRRLLWDLDECLETYKMVDWVVMIDPATDILPVMVGVFLHVVHFIMFRLSVILLSITFKLTQTLYFSNK